jgi:hypothetical protein
VHLGRRYSDAIACDLVNEALLCGRDFDHGA